MPTATSIAASRAAALTGSTFPALQAIERKLKKILSLSIATPEPFRKASGITEGLRMELGGSMRIGCTDVKTKNKS
jgi:hypothetical protein